MKKLTGIVLILAMTLGSCTKSVTGEGAIITETRNTAIFTGVRLEGSGEVEIVQGPVQSVTITGYANLIPIYTSSVHNGTLVLKFETGYNNIRRNNIKTKIVVPDITKATINGSGSIAVAGFLNNGSMETGINGSGKIKISNAAFTKLSADINGSGDIDAYGANTAEARAEIHGSGYVAVSCSQKLIAKISGSGNIDYWGNPAVDLDISGSGKVRKK